MKVTSFSLLFFLLINFVTAQKIDYSSATIADNLKENANAVVRLNQIDIIIASQRSMTIKTQRAITVFNEKGKSAIDAVERYNKNSSIKNIEAIVYDASGSEIKKIKRKDFKDESAVAQGTLVSDSRYLYLEYTPISYPYTIVYNSELETSTTAFIPRWMPVSNFNTSVEKSSMSVTYPNALGFEKKEFNFSNHAIEKTTDTDTQLSYVASAILAQKPEDYSPSYDHIFPRVMMRLEYFNLEGVDGNAKNWQEYGKWFSDKILSGTTELPEETKSKIKLLVGTEKDPIQKAKIIYNFVQKKCRYISVQVGIGGFKPMLAADVDRLGYGDCKALSNYTRALLNVVDVPSYYTELYGDKDKIDMDPDFFSIQGNHVILCIPNKEKYIFLECTSQDDPFGYQANFTDDRNVVIIKPEGGEIVRTKIYEDEGNVKSTIGNYTIVENGNFTGSLTMVSEGSQYDTKVKVSNLQPAEKERYYKHYWSTINNLKLAPITVTNDKENVRFTENVQLSAANYGTISGAKMMFVINAFNQSVDNVKRIRNRKNPFQIQRGFMHTDEIEINLPTGFTVEFLPPNFELKNKFGEYKTEIIKTDTTKLIFKRSIFIQKGYYSNVEYDEYRIFMEQVSKNDNAKIILTKI
ncbi:DUF3857 domain-containing protein [Flavobacterium sp. TAB 87]|uniref:DUF3857 domain-containing protein n=1 Tax=Flavobacterium sp. TAB 87 TaxID=1729581 RepID=UPI00076CD7B8|nr:DUF3857 domain-containing protein [Flavobacterium sp. TAB 87]KVV13140.1 hypothetical protein AP058_02502 [Flavobacterium sp. TAB 87]